MAKIERMYERIEVRPVFHLRKAHLAVLEQVAKDNGLTVDKLMQQMIESGTDLPIEAYYEDREDKKVKLLKQLEAALA